MCCPGWGGGGGGGGGGRSSSCLAHLQQYQAKQKGDSLQDVCREIKLFKDDRSHDWAKLVGGIKDDLKNLVR